MGVRTAETITGVSVFMADLQIGRQRSEGLHYSASRRRLTKGHEKTARKGKKRGCRPASAGHAGGGAGAQHSFAAQDKAERPCGELSLIRGGVGLDFVGAGAVEARDGDIQKAKIHGEL